MNHPRSFLLSPAGHSIPQYFVLNTNVTCYLSSPRFCCSLLYSSSSSVIPEIHHVCSSHSGFRNQQPLSIVLFSSLVFSLSLSLFLPSAVFSILPWFGESYSHGEVCCFKCADFSSWSERSSCDQAGFSLVRIARCFTTPCFLPPLIFITSSFFSPSAKFPLILKPLACSPLFFFCFIITSEH